jgi:hypothetical protein
VINPMCHLLCRLVCSECREHNLKNLLDPNGTCFACCHFRAQKVSIFKAYPIQWPSKWIFPHQNHCVPRHINKMYINIYTYLFREHSVNIVCYTACVQSPNLYNFKEPRNQFQGIDSASLCSLCCNYITIYWGLGSE